MPKHSWPNSRLSNANRHNKSTASESIKAVAIYEIVKGLGALLGAVALWRWHSNLELWLQTATVSWQRNFGKILAPQIESSVQIAQRASQNWPLFLLFICIYATIRFVEAYGLWQDKTWAYWFSVLGYGIFIPVEVYYLVTSPFDWFKLFILLLNIIIVIIVYRNMKRKGLI
ncbi:DUF2127 domain-containing protein [Psychrobacter sp. AH5]|uniref:DUF2127 domain-containing protein n=1 Tax=Psychrobacter sp. AH5 TaxID=2937433 RepID=UPI00333EBE79